MKARALVWIELHWNKILNSETHRMIIIEKISDMWAGVDSFERSLGLVPTMGFLHQGHRSLLKLAREQNRTLMASLFVNPKQFGPSEDFEKYPRNWNTDIEVFEQEGVDVLFVPSNNEMYPSTFSTYIDVGDIGRQLEGSHRPDHFSGVATVVCKLLNICKPDRAYFGQKDAQQCAVVKKFCEDLNLETQIVTSPTVRDHDGLALSSRNIYLSPVERDAALLMNKALEEARRMWICGERDSVKLCVAIEQILTSNSLIKIDYVTLVDSSTFQDSNVASEGSLIAIAARIGSARLIDNVILNFTPSVQSTKGI